MGILTMIGYFYFILLNHNLQDKSGNVKPQCEHISQTYGDLGIDEYTPAAAASIMSLELLILIDHKTANEATLSSNKHAY